MPACPHACLTSVLGPRTSHWKKLEAPQGSMNTRSSTHLRNKHIMNSDLLPSAGFLAIRQAIEDVDDSNTEVYGHEYHHLNRMMERLCTTCTSTPAVSGAPRSLQAGWAAPRPSVSVGPVMRAAAQPSSSSAMRVNAGGEIVVVCGYRQHNELRCIQRPWDGALIEGRCRTHSSLGYVVPEDMVMSERDVNRWDRDYQLPGSIATSAAAIVAAGAAERSSQRPQHSQHYSQRQQVQQHVQQHVQEQEQEEGEGAWEASHDDACVSTCPAILKKGAAREGQPCGLPIISHGFCGRHNKTHIQ